MQNFLDVLANTRPAAEIYVFTTKAFRGKQGPYLVTGKKIHILRLGVSGSGMNPISRFWNYGVFFMGTFFYLVAKKPVRILYYETISSFPAWLYRKFFNKETEVLIHYHEYTSPEEYQAGMRLTWFFHKKREMAISCCQMGIAYE